MNWFAVKCPVNEEEQRWIEENFIWLLEDLGKETFEDVEIILPTQDFFQIYTKVAKKTSNPCSIVFAVIWTLIMSYWT